VTTPLPDWMQDFIGNARSLVGIDEGWHITGKLVDAPDHRPDTDGACWPDAVYLNARLELSRDLQPDEHGRRVILHELLHIIHAEMDEVVERLRDAEDQASRELLYELYNDALERALQRIGRAMIRKLAIGDWENDQLETERREALACYAHEAWSGWMDYLFKQSRENEDGTVTIPADLVARWRRQMGTTYADLPSKKSESDRREAAEILRVLKEVNGE